MKHSKYLLATLAIAFITAFTGCGGDDDEPEVNQAPGNFSVSVAEVTLETATVNWTQAIDPDGDEVTYSVTLNNQQVASGLTTTSLALTNLTADTQYNGTVTATDEEGAASSATFSFKTNGNQSPEMFSVSVGSITTTGAALTWSQAIDPDGDEVTYDVVVDNNTVATGLTTTSYTFTDLAAATQYTGTVIASDGNGGTASASFSFTTESAANQNPGSFTVTVGEVTATTAVLTWTAATDPDGDNVTYSVGYNGNEVANGITDLTYTIESLTAETTYNGKVFASDGNGGTSEVEFSFTTSSGGISDADCPNDNTINTTNIGCSQQPTATSEYSESVAGGVRTIVTNSYPNHEFSTRANNVTVEEKPRTYTMDATPTLASSPTSILTEENRPRYFFGVGLNGVSFDPAPAEPFIFENTQTGEYNWDWVFEPNNNQTEVSLDCATAHVGPDGYHYHGDMLVYAELLSPGITTGTAPTEPVQIGWASDGHPIFYKYGPNASGNIALLQPSYELKDGLRPGDGVSTPCGSYSGKYTNDYEFIEGSGDLDECNGIERSITVTTSQGTETFNYFYMITDDFPVMPRCVMGTPDDSFAKGG